MDIKKIIMLWVVSFLVMAAIVIYQRVTGPTYPITAKIEINSQSYKFSLPRTHPGEGDQIISLAIPDKSVKGKFISKRFKSNDEWQTVSMVRNHENLEASIPHQPTAGKIIYQIILESNGREFSLTQEPVIIRFNSGVPTIVLILHLFFLFASLTLSMRTGFEVIFKGNKVLLYAFLTVISLFIGGLIIGPIMQKFAFDAYWTGWPLGHDLTDNKTLVAFLFWLLALWRLKVNPEKPIWAIVAMVVTLIVFLIPHSVLGSELDYSKMPR